jgi:dynein heavy chain
MYGGHITDDWDRVLCAAYLTNFIHAGCVDDLELAPGLVCHVFETYASGREYMDTQTPPETPMLYGLHANAEIGFQTASANKLFHTINELQPKTAGGSGTNPEDEVQAKLDDVMGNLPDLHPLGDISERLDEDRTPQQHVFYQECERTNALRQVLYDTLYDLDLGLKGALSMSDAMQNLYNAVLLDQVDPVWTAASFMSMRPMGSWFSNMLERNAQLTEWVGELATPKVAALNLFFNPMSFLTAIMQDTAIKNSFDLDQMALVSDVLKKMPDAIEYAAKDGAHIFGMIMEGARWDTQQGSIEDSHMKDLYPKVPVVTIRSLPLGKIDRKDQYECPLYKTQARGAGIVTGLFLKTKQNPRKWVIAGVACLLDVAD